jgi:hypothetical protein
MCTTRVRRAEGIEMLKGWERNTGEWREGDKGAKGIKDRKKG